MNVILSIKLDLVAKSVQGGSKFRAGGGAVAYSDKNKRKYQLYVTNYLIPFAPEVPFDCPVKASFLFVLPRPKSLRGTRRSWHVAKPDHDNLVKSIQDTFGVPNKRIKRKMSSALVGARILRDDSIICDVHTRKVVAAKGERPSVSIQLTEIEDAYPPEPK